MKKLAKAAKIMASLAAAASGGYQLAKSYQSESGWHLFALASNENISQRKATMKAGSGNKPAWQKAYLLPAASLQTGGEKPVLYTKPAKTEKWRWRSWRKPASAINRNYCNEKIWSMKEINKQYWKQYRKLLVWKCNVMKMKAVYCINNNNDASKIY